MPRVSDAVTLTQFTSTSKSSSSTILTLNKKFQSANDMSSHITSSPACDSIDPSLLYSNSERSKTIAQLKNKYTFKFTQTLQFSNLAV